MEKKIYVVTSGEYSDYTIDAVFSTKEKADEYIQQHGNGFDIEEYELDQEVEKKTQLWLITFTEEGEEAGASVTQNHNNENRVDTCFFNPLWRVERYISFYVNADSMDRAIKIARERYAAIKANEYIWLRLSRPYDIDKYGIKRYESFNVRTNEFIK